VSLPLPAVGGPAARALEAQGVRTLDDVARWTRKELLALHGVGPKAVRILEEALEAQGMALTGP
jgi:predicted flap endonuclease-1-like 5' DNA nuclease